MARFDGICLELFSKITVILFYFVFSFRTTFEHFSPADLSRNIRKSTSTRIKREFMFVSSLNNASSYHCYQGCNDEWQVDFEEAFKINRTEFYDFPFHPILLNYTNYFSYCRISDKRTLCFIDRCGDESADRVFSPSNFLCNYRKRQFLRVIKCLETSEPITFLKCDQECHNKLSKAAKMDKNVTTALGKVFTDVEAESYNNELNVLCTFQDCYLNCQQEIISKLCEKRLADEAINMISVYIHWHSSGLVEWHKTLTDDKNFKLPVTCAKLLEKLTPDLWFGRNASEFGNG